jgi:hypothetical protein
MLKKEYLSIDNILLKRLKYEYKKENKNSLAKKKTPSLMIVHKTMNNK